MQGGLIVIYLNCGSLNLLGLSVRLSPKISVRQAVAKGQLKGTKRLTRGYKKKLQKSYSLRHYRRFRFLWS